jgi:hypothetical protein
MALHIHAEEWLSHISKVSRKKFTTKTKTKPKQKKHVAMNTYSLKTNHTPASGIGGGGPLSKRIWLT